MQTSRALRAFSYLAPQNKKFSWYLTPWLAKEILKHASLCRPANYDKAGLLALHMLMGTFDNSDPIIINTDGQLQDGVQRLEAFLLTDLEKLKMKFVIRPVVQVYYHLIPHAAFEMERVPVPPTFLAVRTLLHLISPGASTGMTYPYKNKPDGIYKWLASFAKGTQEKKELSPDGIKAIAEYKLKDLLELVFEGKELQPEPIP